MTTKINTPLSQVLYETLHGQAPGATPFCNMAWEHTLPESKLRYEAAAQAVAAESRRTVKQPAGSRLCGAAVAAMATNQTLDYVVQNARGDAECCSRLMWMAEYLARKGVLLGTYASVSDWRTGERLTIEGNTNRLELKVEWRGRHSVIGVDSETVVGQLHWVFWDGEHVRDPSPESPSLRPISDYAGKIVDIYPLTYILDEAQ